MAGGPLDSNTTAAGYGSIMSLKGPTDDPSRQRRRLKPGMRLTDGTIYSGNTRLDAITTEEAAIQAQIDELRGQLARLKQERSELEAEMAPEPVEESKPKPKQRKTKE